MTVHAIWIALSGLSLLASLELLIDAARGRRHLAWLRDVAPPRGAARDALPAVSIVVAARNEERRIEAAARTLLAMDYPRLEVVIVEDRSTDGTGAILDRLGAADARLRVIHVTELPSGWLGKCHALQLGADNSSGELLLFTDADVVFEPTSLARAVQWMHDRKVDHLAGAVDIHAEGFWLQAFVAAFSLVFNAYYRPWRAASASRRWYAGFGGFNLVRRQVYDAIGGHTAVALDPLDDVHLGRAIKESGARQVCAVLARLATVEWYPTLGQAIRGLEKNTLAAAMWSPAFLFVGSIGQLAWTVWPFAALLMTTGLAWWVSAAAAVMVLGVTVGLLRETTLPARVAFALPLAVPIIVYTYWRAVYLTYRRGGVDWRGTFYSIDELRSASRRSR